MRVAVGQMTSTSVHATNLHIANELCERAKAAGAAMLALPECFAFIGGSEAKETVAQATALNDEPFGDFQGLARRHGLWLSCGGFHERASASKVYNSHVIVDASGSIVRAYRKCHLFDVSIPGGAVLMESKTTVPGDAVAEVVETPVGRLGLTTCYDLRFPELFTALARRGAEVILVPSAFTVPTGLAHWHLLLRARAVETQCYVAAAAQVGTHNAKRRSFGHALAVDPWGDVLADAGGEASPAIVCFDVDRDKLATLRARMPIQKHRRQDVLELALFDRGDDEETAAARDY
ncbi:hypothetical protein CTAYLR_004536 [Chrysophaeum taylorii]|uniref:CN hydrolase domain-containing protein n=1 Tax=Chrysophaeum taylorii TaxID=2483200 RepID=A0AAD7XQ46_9STRA|nr:hypothetical protein CTAYLR_004536 [Chrysophaeum taylorii]